MRGCCCVVNSRLLRNTPDTLLPLIDTVLHTGKHNTVESRYYTSVGVFPLLWSGNETVTFCM